MDDQPKQPQPQTAVLSPILNRPIILGDLTLGSPSTQTTIGGVGGASALPATPLGYLLINLAGTGVVAIPYYNAT